MNTTIDENKELLQAIHYLIMKQISEMIIAELDKEAKA